MKMTQLLLSGLAGIALALVACNPKEQTDAAPPTDSNPNGKAALSGDMETVSIKVSGMT
jgi:hypothetical protein